MFKKTQKDTVPVRRRQVPTESRTIEESRVFASTFRRGRTLTGSVSGSIRSSNEFGADMLSPRAHVHHLARHRMHLFRWFVTVIVVGIGLYMILSQLIASVSIRGGEVTLTDSQQVVYQKLIDTYLGSHPSERLFPLLDTSNLTAFVAQTNPEVSGIVLHQTGIFGNAQADITFRRPVARWSIDGASQYVDQSGIVFSNNMFAVPTLTIVDANTINSSGTSTSSLVASHRFLGFVGQIVGDMARNGLTVTQATIPLLTTRQLEVTVNGIPYVIKLTVDRSAGEQVEDALRVINYQRSHGVAMTYIDVRVPGKAYYK